MPGAKGDPAPSADAVVDVAITAYKRATFVGEAIESVLGQTFDAWRLRVFENGLGGGDIETAVQPYLSDRRVSFHPSGHELELPDNWTRAIRAGTATYVALLHDDDRWHPDFLRARVEALATRPECGLAYGEWVVVDESGRETSRAPFRFSEGVVPRVRLAHALVRANVIGGATILVRRSAYETVGAAFDGRWFYTDWEMWARLAARFPAYYLARQDSDFRRHAEANSFVSPEDPERFLAMMDHVETLFEAEVDGFRLSRRERAEARSLALLHGASAVHQGGGWRDSAPLYRRAIRQYPPTLLRYTSLAMLAKSLLGRRGTNVVARALRVARRSTTPTG
jgi:glycosyltransferase involved in cell wall biosynthesis